MATSGIIQTSPVFYGTYFKVNWSRTAVSEANNTSTIKWTVYLVTPGASWYSNAVKINSLVIDGSTVCSNQTYSNKSHGTFELASGTKTISHNDDGTKSFAMSFSGWLIDEGNQTASGTFTLDQINRGKPTASLSITLNNSASATVAGWGVAVKGITKISYSITGTPYDVQYAVTGYQFQGNGQTINTQTGTTSALASSGTLTFIGKVKDSRNVWSEAATQTQNVYDYTPPKVTAASAFRSNSSGTETVSGEYITISCTGAIGTNADIGSRNSIASVSYEVTDNDSGTSVKTGTLTNGTASTVSLTASGGFDINKAYLVTFTVGDTVGTDVVRTILVPKAIVTLDLAEGGLGVGIGIVASNNEALTINPDWNIFAYGALIDLVIGQGLETTTGSQTCNWYYQKYQSGQFYAHMSGELSSSSSSATKSATIALPWTLPNTAYQVQLTGTTNSHLLVNMGVRDSAGTGSGKSTTQFTVYATLSSASSSSVGVDISIHGYWK